jgi:hypothetical protein
VSDFQASDAVPSILTPSPKALTTLYWIVYMTHASRARHSSGEGVAKYQAVGSGGRGIIAVSVGMVVVAVDGIFIDRVLRLDMRIFI